MKKRSPTGKNTDRAFAELSWDPSIHAAQIGVEAKDGIVTLAGHVSSYSDKWNAERTAQRVSGIRAITVEIDVKLPGSSKRTDVDVANSVENALVWATDLLQGNLKVIVENGWVTLGGNVDWDYQRQSAASAIRHLTGVRGVSCDIAVKPKVSMSDVKSDIEAALKRRAISESQKIIVAVDGSSITLSGTAHSWSEREPATHSVWGTPGVQHVVNEITVLN